MWSLSAGYVLVGGRSTRMGRDKALLEWRNPRDAPNESIALAGHVAKIVEVAAGSVTLVGDPDHYGHLGFPVVDDLHPGLGPLSGIEAALSHTAADWNLIVACDLPNLDPGFLRMLLNRKENVVASDSNGPALCGVLHRDVRSAVAQVVGSGQLSWNGFLDRIGAVRVPAASPKILANINTPQDLVTHE
ncbi:MAG: molybdenum cofactor guanylyltransferase [Bryobacteraceae bacterium]